MSTNTKDVIAQQHSIAMAHHLMRRAAAIMLHRTDGRFGGLGSGTFIEISGRHFVSTAAHVVEGVQLEQVGVVALGGPVGKLSNITPRLVGWNHRGGGKHDSLDIAWLEIKPEAVPLLIKEWDRDFVTLDRISLDIVPSDAPVYVFGAPGEFMQDWEIGGREFKGIKALPYLTRALPMQGRGQPERDLFVEYTREMQTVEGVTAALAPDGP